jgi:hypothetical protein
MSINARVLAVSKSFSEGISPRRRGQHGYNKNEKKNL